MSSFHPLSNGRNVIFLISVFLLGECSHGDERAELALHGNLRQAKNLLLTPKKKEFNVAQTQKWRCFVNKKPQKQKYQSVVVMSEMQNSFKAGLSAPNFLGAHKRVNLKQIL